MRILFLALDVDLAKQRGDTVHAIELASALSSLGHDIFLVVGADGAARNALASGLPVHVASHSDAGILRELSRIVREFRPTLVYERRTTPKISFAAHALWGLPVVMEINGVLRDELILQGRSAKGWAMNPVKNRLRAAMFREVDRFVAVSQGVADDLVASFGVDRDRIAIIGNGVNIARFRPMAKEDACHSLHLDPSAPRIVFVGNLAPWRNIELFIAVLTAALRRNPSANLLVVGRGEGEDKLRQAAREGRIEAAISFAGEVAYERVPDFVACADVALVPNIELVVDVSPLKVFEYLACERPVVASKVAGLEFIETMGLGRVIPPWDPDGFAAATVELLENPARRAEMGRRGRMFVESERSWSSVARRVSAVLEEAVG
jgi:glycosyltransferase involved in cell wall biosynthesis